MGTHELLITELVYRNLLTNLQPAEIAAILSAFVFQRGSDGSAYPELPVLKEVHNKQLLFITIIFILK